jgi:hypothetical protein
VGRRDDIEVVGGAVALVILCTTSEFDVMHLAELCYLDRVVGLERVRGPIVAVVVGASLDLHFVSNGLALLLAAPKDACSV